MITPDLTQLLKDYVTPAQTIVILFPTTASFDQIASATALAVGLESLGKTVSLLSPHKVPENVLDLPGIERVSHQFGNKDLQISFHYEPDMVEKVSYHIDEETQKFHLIIQPKKGHIPLNSQTVEFAYAGAEADLIITVGLQNLEALEDLFFQFEPLYSSSPIISIHTFETEFGTIKVDTSSTASSCEIIAAVLPELGVSIENTIATDLLAGIERATDSFRSLSTTADTLETASKLLRAGARRLPRAAAPLPRNGFAEAFANANKNLEKTMPIKSLPLHAHQNGNGKNKKSARPSLPSPSEMQKMEGGSRL